MRKLVISLVVIIAFAGCGEPSKQESQKAMDGIIKLFQKCGKLPESEQAKCWDEPSDQ